MLATPRFLDTIWTVQLASGTQVGRFTDYVDALLVAKQIKDATVVSIEPKQA